MGNAQSKSMIKFLSNLVRPKWKHHSPIKRITAIKKITDQDTLVEIANNDIDGDVRNSAADHVEDRSRLAKYNELQLDYDNKLREKSILDRQRLKSERKIRNIEREKEEKRTRSEIKTREKERMIRGHSQDSRDYSNTNQITIAKNVTLTNLTNFLREQSNRRSFNDIFSDEDFDSSMKERGTEEILIGLITNDDEKFFPAMNLVLDGATFASREAVHILQAAIKIRSKNNTVRFYQPGMIISTGGDVIFDRYLSARKEILELARNNSLLEDVWVTGDLITAFGQTSDDDGNRELLREISAIGGASEGYSFMLVFNEINQRVRGAETGGA